MGMAGRPIPNAIRKLMQKATVKQTDMEAELLSNALDVVTGSIDKHTLPEGVNMEAAARLIKDTLDKQYGFNWHCVIGQGYSFDVSAENGTLLYVFHQTEYAMSIFKC